MKKYVFGNIGVLLVIIGIFLIVMQPFVPITGAVIDVSTNFSKIWFGVGVLMIIGGTVLASFKKDK